MLNFYIPKIKFSRGGKLIDSFSLKMELLEESEVDSKKIKVTWENLKEFYSKYQECILPFSIWNFKKGRVISFYNIHHKDVKEWKEPLNITVEVEYEPCYSVSLNDVLKYNDINKAIQYLRERGLFERSE